MAELGLSDDFADILLELADAHAEFLLIGGWALAARRSFSLNGREIPFIGRAALVKNKRAAARAKDMADVDWLEKHPEAAPKDP